MAGTAKPSTSDLKKEGSYSINSFSTVSGTTGASALFDAGYGTSGTTVGQFWYSSANYVDITLNQVTTIWGVDYNDTTAAYHNKLNIKKWDGSQFVQYGTTNQISSPYTSWQKICEKLPVGRYRFEYLSGNVIFTEWYLETAETNKFLISLSDTELYSMQVADTTVNVARESGVIVTASQTSAGAPSALVDGAIIANSWFAASNTNVWIDIEFASSKEIFRYAMATAAGGYGVMPSPKDWALQGSNDNFATFDTLDTQTGITGWVDSVKKVFDVPKDKIKAYKKYRIYVFQSGHPTSGTHINEIEMYEDYVRLVALNTTINENDLNSRGLSKGFVVDLNRSISKKIDIASTSVTLGSGKVFKKTIDTSKKPIRKVTVT